MSVCRRWRWLGHCPTTVLLIISIVAIERVMGFPCNKRNTCGALLVRSCPFTKQTTVLVTADGFQGRLTCLLKMKKDPSKEDPSKEDPSKEDPSKEDPSKEDPDDEYIMVSKKEIKQISKDPLAMNDFLKINELEETEQKETLTTDELAILNFPIDNLDDMAENRSALEEFIQRAESLLAKVGEDNRAFRDSVGVARSLLRMLDKRLAQASGRFERIASVGFRVESEKLFHDHDLQRFTSYVIELFDWFMDPDIRRKYLAPYFPLVQSSGTGKTKLLWELRELINSNDQFARYECRTILCVDKGSRDNNLGDTVFSTYLEVGRFATDQARIDIQNSLDNILKGCKSQNVILLFDESQRLLRSKAFPFRCIRWWLRLRVTRPKVVAVFTGTTLQLTNFYAEPPPSSSSREPITSYYTSGTALYRPFYNLRTTGIFAPGALDDDAQNDFERAIPHGRPLFQVLHKNEGINNDKIASILDKMLMVRPSRSPWESSLKACVSILGTRLQLGQTTDALLAEELVANGYAWLTHFDDSSPTSDSDETYQLQNVARICFKPDPVCAMLAMSMMDEEWSISNQGSIIKGKDKRFWTSKMCEVFSTGLCYPNQGDLGEIAGAAFLLFSGDVVRKRIDANYRTFSVPLVDYVGSLLNQNYYDESDDAVDIALDSTNKQQQRQQTSYTEAHVSFIQVVRNYLRFPIKDLGDERLGVLKYMYTAGIAYYSYPFCPVFDMVISIRLTRPDGSFFHAPMLVSISTRKDSQSNSEILVCMTEILEDAGTIGVGIRLVFDAPHENATELLSKEDVDSLLNGNIVSKVLVVPEDDQFGIVKLLLETVSDGPVTNEIDSSDYYLVMPDLRKDDYDQEKLLRSTAKREEKDYLKKAIDRGYEKERSKGTRRRSVGAKDATTITSNKQEVNGSKKKTPKRKGRPKKGENRN